MNKVKCFFVVAGLSLFLCAASQAKEEKVIQFTTLPEVVRTTVFHHYNIVSPEKVVRVVEYPDNIYQVTVLTDSGEQIIYLNAGGTIVERPSTVVGEREEGTAGSAEVTVTMDQIQSGGERYVFVQDQGPDAIYIDHQTNKRVIVKGAAGKGNRGGVRMKEENRGSVRTEEQDRSNVRSTEKTNEQSGNVREKNDNGNANQGEKNLRQEHRTDRDQRAQDQRDQGNRGTIGNGQEQGNKDASGNPRTEEKNAGQRNMTNEQQGQKPERETNRTPGEQQQSKERSTGKEKASPTP